MIGCGWKTSRSCMAMLRRSRGVLFAPELCFGEEMRERFALRRSSSARERTCRPDLLEEPAVAAGPSRSFRQAKQKRKRSKRRMRNAGKRCSTTSASCDAALPPLERSSSPVGVPPRFSPKGVIVPKAQLQARLPGTWSERALPAFACPSPASTSRPGHNAGRLMPKPPGSELQTRPRAPPSPDGPVCLRPASFTKARRRM